MSNLSFDKDSTCEFQTHCVDGRDLQVRIGNGSSHAYVVLRAYRGRRTITAELIADVLSAINHYYTGHSWKTFSSIEIVHTPIILNCVYKGPL